MSTKARAVCIANRSTKPQRPTTIMAAGGAQGKPGSTMPAGPADSGVKGAGGRGVGGGVGLGPGVGSVGVELSAVLIATLFLPRRPFL